MLQKKGCFASDTLSLYFIKKSAKEKIREQNSHRETFLSVMYTKSYKYIVVIFKPSILHIHGVRWFSKYCKKTKPQKKLRSSQHFGYNSFTLPLGMMRWHYFGIGRDRNQKKHGPFGGSDQVRATRGARHCKLIQNSDPFGHARACSVKRRTTWSMLRSDPFGMTFPC